MDRFSEPLHRYLQLVHSSTLLVSQADRANLNAILTMLGTLDQDIINARYGIFGRPLATIGQLADRYRVSESAIEEIVEKDLHRLAITPEWQLMLRQLRPAVQKKIGFVKPSEASPIS